MNEVLKVVGTHPVREAIKSGKEIEKILVSRETSNSEFLMIFSSSSLIHLSSIGN